MTFPWREWVVALYRPPIVDDEEVPAHFGLVPWWAWFRDVPRADIERRPRHEGTTTFPMIYYGAAYYDAAPSETDDCNVGGVCNGACRTYEMSET